MAADEQPMRHQCGEECVCPVHGTPLIYWPHGEDHACQDINCQHGRGMTDEQRARTARWTGDVTGINHDGRIRTYRAPQPLGGYSVADSPFVYPTREAAAEAARAADEQPS